MNSGRQGWRRVGALFSAEAWIRSNRIVFGDRSDYLIGVITFRQLRYLAALAEHRHFGRAAQACAVTQPALSMQIRELEKLLGVELVERRQGDVALTDIGAEVVRRGERVLTASRDLVDFAQHQGRLLTGRLALGVIPTLGPYVMPKILPVLQSRYPELRLELRETQTKVLLEELSGGGLDVVMLAPVPAEVETLALFDDLLLRRCRPAMRCFPWRVSARDIDQRRLSWRRATACATGGGLLRQRETARLGSAPASPRSCRWSPRLA